MNKAVVFAVAATLWVQTARAQQKNLTPIPKEEKTLTFGNIVISKLDKLGGASMGIGKKAGGKLRLTGQTTLITVTDEKARRVLKLHADTIDLRFGKTEDVGLIDMIGNVRYDVVQTLADGSKRTLNGTAAKGIYSPDTKTIELSGGVNAAFTEEARLSAPGTLKAAKVKVNIGKQPYSYEITGGSHSELTFAPRANAKSKPGTGQIKTISIVEFASGTFKPGEEAIFKGSATVADLAFSDGGTAKIEGDSLETMFGGDKSTLLKAEAQGNARYSFLRAATKEKQELTAKGSSASAVYDVNAETMTLDGKVDATILAPESLQSPARLLADRVTFRTQKPYRYEITSTADRALLKFTPLPPKETKPDPTAEKPADISRRFVSGEIKITNFTEGTFEPEKRAQLRGGRPIFESSDPETKSSTRLQAAQMTATYNTADADSIARTEATGGVDFALVQPKEKGKPQTAIRGKAEKAVFLNDPQERRVEMTGPITANVVDPEHLAEPGKVTGGDDVTLSIVYLAGGYTFNIESPKETAVLSFKPKDTSKQDGNGKKSTETDKK